MIKASMFHSAFQIIEKLICTTALVPPHFCFSIFWYAKDFFHLWHNMTCSATKILIIQDSVNFTNCCDLLCWIFEFVTIDGSFDEELCFAWHFAWRLLLTLVVHIILLYTMKTFIDIAIWAVRRRDPFSVKFYTCRYE